MCGCLPISSRRECLFLCRVSSGTLRTACSTRFQHFAECRTQLGIVLCSQRCCCKVLRLQNYQRVWVSGKGGSQATHPGAFCHELLPPNHTTPHVFNMCSLFIVRNCTRIDASLGFVIQCDSLRQHRAHCLQRPRSTFERCESGAVVASRKKQAESQAPRLSNNSDVVTVAAAFSLR